MRVIWTTPDGRSHQWAVAEEQRQATLDIRAMNIAFRKGYDDGLIGRPSVPDGLTTECKRWLKTGRAKGREVRAAYERQWKLEGPHAHSR